MRKHCSEVVPVRVHCAHEGSRAKAGVAAAVMNMTVRDQHPRSHYRDKGATSNNRATDKVQSHVSATGLTHQ